jgi:hypothetical protein
VRLAIAERTARYCSRDDRSRASSELDQTHAIADDMRPAGHVYIWALEGWVSSQLGAGPGVRGSRLTYVTNVAMAGVVVAAVMLAGCTGRSSPAGQAADDRDQRRRWTEPGRDPLPVR